MKISLKFKILLVVVIPLAMQIVFIAVISKELERLATAQNLEQHFVKVTMARDRYIINERQLTVIVTLFLSTANKFYRQKYIEAQVDSSAIFKELDKLWSDNPDRLRILGHYWSLLSQRDQAYMNIFQNTDTKDGTIQGMLNGTFSMQSPMLRQAMLNQKVPLLQPLFDQDQEQKLRQAEAVEQAVKSIYLSLYTGLSALLLASLISGLLLSFSVSRRLKIVLSNIEALTNSDAELVTIKGGDEISSLNAAVVTTATLIRDAEEFQAQTIAIIADELNKPLAAVDEALQKLSKFGFESLSEKGAKRLGDANAEIKRLESLVSELVNLDAAGRKLELAQVDLADLAANCLKIVEPLSKAKSITITLNTAGHAVAFADGDKTTQVLINLLSNAIKYSPENSTIEVEINSTEQDVTVVVRDHGPGIPEEFRSRIFQRFEQAESAPAQKPASSGLGLKISKELIESQGGKVGFSSKVGDGSDFWFSLPLTEKSHESEDITSKSGTSRGWKTTLWKKALLVVALPVLVQLVTVSALLNFMHQTAAKIAELEKIPKITALHEKLMTGVATSEIFSGTYNIERLPSDLIVLRREQSKLRKNMAELEKLTTVNNVTDVLTVKLVAAINEYLVLYDYLVSSKPNVNVAQFVQSGPNGSAKQKTLLIDTRDLLKQLTIEQNELIARNAQTSEEIRHNFQMIMYASAIVASIVASVLGLLIAKGLTNRVQRISNLASRFSHHRELIEPLPGNDELAFIEQQLHTAEKKLMELEIMRAEMIGITSHELRTPLSSLIALTEVIEAGVFGTLTEQGEKTLAVARSETTELIVLITNLLDLEKMRSGKNLVNKQSSNVEQIFQQVLSDNVVPAESKGITLTVKDNRQEILADSGRLTQALTAIVRSILNRAPAKSDVVVQCKTVRDTVIISIDAPHGVAVKDYRNKYKDFAREEMAISLARLTALQHGGQFELVTSTKGRLIEMRLPAS